MLLSDKQIKEMQEQYNVIDDFVDSMVRYTDAGKVVSYGLGSTGYDLRLGGEFWVPAYQPNTVVSPGMDINTVATTGDYFILQPHQYVLGRTVERINMPTHISGLAFGKSTYARMGILVNVTPFEPGWRGTPTLSIANTGDYPVRLLANQGIIQLMFFEAGSTPDVSYAERGGKYQDQDGITTARL